MKRDDRDKMTTGVRLPEMVEELGLEVVHCGADYETALVGIKDVNRPGLQLAGYFDHFEPIRLQVMGNVEMSYLEKMTPAEQGPQLEGIKHYAEHPAGS